MTALLEMLYALVDFFHALVARLDRWAETDPVLGHVR